MKGIPVALGISALVVSLLPLPGAAAAGLAVALVTVLLTEPGVLRSSFGLRPLILVALAASLTALAVAWGAGASRGVAVGGAVALRLFVLLLVTAAASRHLNAEDLQAFADRLHLPRLGLTLGLALNSLPHLAEAWRDAWIALSVRARRRRPRLRDLPLLAETLLAHAARIAEEASAAAALRGHPALMQPLLGSAEVPHVVAVIGRSGSGKTPALARAIGTLQQRGVQLFGFVQPAEIGETGKTGFRVRDVHSFREALLARRVGPEEGQHGTPFVFDARGFALARQALAEASTGCVLVADELGPVELRGAGHWPALRRALARRPPAVLLLGVRRQLVAALLDRLAAESARVVDVEAGADAAGEIVRAVESALFVPTRRR